jgi:SAM-dependent methyltransferase
VTSNELHLDRDRAESFGSIAEQYDRYRPTCAPALIDDLVALNPSQVLDVGCGTGRVAAALTRRGLDVLGVELDERMAEVARGHGIPVELSAFETWDDTGRRFDLITCSDAWHWIEPTQGLTKAAALLRPGGTFARLWNYHLLDDHVADAFDTVYREHAPSADPHARGPQNITEPSTKDGQFAPGETKTYHWERALTADEWIGMAATFSDHQRLAPESLATLKKALHKTIEELGGTVHAHGSTYAILSQGRGAIRSTP